MSWCLGSSFFGGRDALLLLGSGYAKASIVYLAQRRMEMRSVQEGKIGYVLLWLLGIPLPILLLVFVLRGCQ
jgi:hypothetical protein